MTEQQTTEPFDLEQVYDEQIFPLMQQMIAICKEHRIPMLASFQYTQDSFCTTFLEYEGRKAHGRLQGALSLVQHGFLAYHVTKGKATLDT